MLKEIDLKDVHRFPLNNVTVISREKNICMTATEFFDDIQFLVDEFQEPHIAAPPYKAMNAGGGWE